jgi:hypothetical protein
MVTIGPENIAATASGKAAAAPALPATSTALPTALFRSGLVAGSLLGGGQLGGSLLLSGSQLRGREDARETVRSGFTAVDALLPAGGLRRGSLVEWLAGGEGAADSVAAGAGAVSLALAVACQLAAAGSGPQTIVVVDRGGWFHPPAVLPWLADSRQLVVARPSHDDDEIWAIDQALRCRGVAAVVAWPRGVAGRSAGSTPLARSAPLASMTWGDRRQQPEQDDHHQTSWRPRSQWTTAMRRWQLAARGSGAVGLFVRPATAAGEPSWAEAKLSVCPLPGGTLLQRRLRLERIGGAWSGGLEGRVVETLLNLTRGCEGMLPRESVNGLSMPRQNVLDTSREGGMACRAS